MKNNNKIITQDIRTTDRYYAIQILFNKYFLIFEPLNFEQTLFTRVRYPCCF